MKKVTVMVLGLLLGLPVFGQPFKETFGKHWKTSGEFTLAVANAMPAENYTFKPNPEEMDFGRVMMHIALANNMFFSRVSGQKNPTPEAIAAAYKDPKSTFQKDDVIKFLTDSFAFCAQALEQAPDDKLSAMLGPEGRQMSGAVTLWSAFTHTAHHRGQAEVYMRAKNVKPPSYRF